MVGDTHIRNADEYVIREGGYHPQAGLAFGYKDRKYDFWFYIETRTAPFELAITHASNSHFSGGIPIVESADQRTIEKNIQKHFETIDLFGREITSVEPAPAVSFTWNLGLR